VHYRWHPLHGRQLRRHYGERRAEGDVVHVEVAPGIVIIVAAWMLDPAACVGMEVGLPRVAVSALADLHWSAPLGGVRPWEWTESSRCFDRLPSVLILELHRAEVSQR
jgi:hypothetical protein